MVAEARAIELLICTLFTVTVQADIGTDIFGVLSELAESMKEGQNCQFKCPPGQIAHKNPHYIPTSNGCGSYGIELDTSAIPDMTNCCNNHDYCYDTFGRMKKSCDDDFEQCLLSMCGRIKEAGELEKIEKEGCVATAKMFHKAASSLGCKAYKESQRKASICRQRSDL